MYYRQSKRTRIILAVIVFSVFIVSLGYHPANTTVALITKIIQDVSKKSENSDWKKAMKGEPLISGDYVRTGERSLAIVKFTDNSLLRVREQSEVRIGGEIAGGAFSKEVNIERGGIGFDVKKQQNEQFRFTSPTSVASIRGTKGKLITGPDGDTLTVTEGTVNLKNNSSNKDVDVPKGSIGFSNPDGSLSSRNATQDELSDANNAATGGSTNELNLEMRDSQGNKKNLKIKYK
jgi:hypothetical protein